MSDNVFEECECSTRVGYGYIDCFEVSTITPPPKTWVDYAAFTTISSSNPTHHIFLLSLSLSLPPRN